MSFHLGCGAEMSRAGVWVVQAGLNTRLRRFGRNTALVETSQNVGSYFLFLWKRNLFVNLEAFAGT
jgi:hypothetical protein